MVLTPRPTPGAQHEDLFGLAERCLREVERRQAGSHGAFEAQATAWLPLHRATVLDIVEN